MEPEHQTVKPYWQTEVEPKPAKKATDSLRTLGLVLLMAIVLLTLASAVIT